MNWRELFKSATVEKPIHNMEGVLATRHARRKDPEAFVTHKELSDAHEAMKMKVGYFEDDYTDKVGFKMRVFDHHGEAQKILQGQGLGELSDDLEDDRKEAVKQNKAEEKRIEKLECERIKQELEEAVDQANESASLKINAPFA